MTGAIRRFALPFAAVVLAGVLLSAPVHATRAGRMWCKSDPIVSLNGRVIDLTVSLPLDKLLAVNGPLRIDIWTPAAVNRKVLVSDVGFNGHGSVIAFHNSHGTVSNNQIPTFIKLSGPID